MNGNMDDSRIKKKDKNQYIQVFVRVRPSVCSERKAKSTIVLDVYSDKELVVRERPQDKVSKKFKFDRVFGPTSRQIDVYNTVVNPLLEEVLAGYNCTVFAYGQTGTGKTFTMEGDVMISNDPALHWQSDTSAGMIPRALSHLFDKLRQLETQEYTIRVSFLELYNEELFDLLSANDDVSKIRLYEDASKKGAVIIHGLKEMTVHNEGEVYNILERGSEKRQTAATLMNAHSSRSHTVFSITVHTKENTIEGEELLKTGKLNLVDLAGSENVGRSGAVDRRAREAGNINQSLLTLGRVIMALVERAPHIPYRESKLTRLLQESLGGRTKTSIIATVSPESINLEETLSTLDYAHRAKNITNRPEINQKLSKRALLKEYTEEIERLKNDLLATRERKGRYIAHDNYNEIQASISYRNKKIEEKLEHIKALGETMKIKENIFNTLQTEYITQQNELHKAKDEVQNVTHALSSANQQLEITKHNRDEQKYLVEKHVSTEKVLLTQAQTLLTVADTVTTDAYKLHDKIARKMQVEQKNETLEEQFRSNIAERILKIEKNLSTYKDELNQFCTSVKNDIDVGTSAVCEGMREAICRISMDSNSQHLNATNDLARHSNNSYLHYQNWIEEEMKNATCVTEYEDQLLTSISMKLAPKICNLVENEIAENLRVLNDSVSQKLNYISSHAKSSVDAICNHLLEDCDRLCERVKEMKDNVDKLLQNQNEIMQKRRSFAELMTDISSQFNLLNKSEEENYSIMTSKFHHIGAVCNDTNNKITHSCKSNIDLQKELEQKVQNSLEKIRNNIATETETNRELARTTTEQTHVLMNELKSTINKSCEGLKQYNNLVECNGKEIQQKILHDKNQVSSTISDMHKMIVDKSASYVQSMEGQKAKTFSTSVEASNKIQNRITELTDGIDRIIEQFHTTQESINKFFVEDVQRDTPTGTTPARKEFSYQRQLKITSPHERILHRFRETRQFLESSKDENNDKENNDYESLKYEKERGKHPSTMKSSERQVLGAHN